MQGSENSLSAREVQFVIAVDRAIYKIARRWIWAVNLIGLLFVLPSLLAPYLRSVGQDEVAGIIYALFGLICHQEPERSFFVFGQKMAYCQRDFAIYGGVLLLGLSYPLLAGRIRPLGLRGAVLLSLPMAIDGFTQLFGWRESTWELRLLTGGLFAVATAWVVLPRLDTGFAEIRVMLETRFERLVREGRARSL